MLVDIIAGARPNFMKIAPIIDRIKNRREEGINIDFRLIHTGQHYDKNMSGSFFEQLNIPHPHINLGAGGGTQAEQTAAIMIGYEQILSEKIPSVCLVVGDVTSTMACAITAQKMHVTVAHVEAGIRSGDWKMPEEINRLVTDAITNFFFTTSEIANVNLLKSGISEENIFFVGNTMIDTLLKHRKRFIKPKIWEEARLNEGEYLVLTLHRPSNVDEKEIFKSLINEIIIRTENLPLIFPVHPRTKKIIDNLGISHKRLHTIDPLSYLEFNYLVERSKAVITDSGGITEETTVLGIPCITLRDTTERPETVEIGTNELVGVNPQGIKDALNRIFSNKWKDGGIPKLWDGNASIRIVEVLEKSFI